LKGFVVDVIYEVDHNGKGEILSCRGTAEKTNVFVELDRIWFAQFHPGPLTARILGILSASVINKSGIYFSTLFFLFIFEA
jgi:hypothetical protein